MAKKRKKKKYGKLVLFVIIILAISIYLLYSTEITLKLKGYSFDDIKVITDKVDSKNMKYIFKNTHNDNYVILIKNSNFIDDNLNKYISYLKENPNVDVNIIVDNINSNNKGEIENKDLLELIKIDSYDKNKKDRYINYAKKYPNVDKEIIVNLVNNDIDTTDAPYNKVLIKLIKEKYFILKNTKRYVNYYLKNKKLDSYDIVINVNSNLDYEFYTNVKKAKTVKGNLILVNKYYNLDKNYKPKDLINLDSKYGYSSPLRKEAYNAFIKLYEAITSDGLSIYLNCAFRDYNLQNSLYTRYLNRDGKEAADTYSARPGHSEHQTGLAFDINNFTNFENTKEYVWLQKNAHKYGFILRFPEGKEYITGYMYEPWHYRYVGIKVATKIKNEDITFEEYYAYYVD